MKNSPLSLLFSLFLIHFTFNSKAQLQVLNLDLEVIDLGKPKDWKEIGNDSYKFEIDSLIVKKGKYAVSIEFSQEGSEFGGLGWRLPHNYEGKKITLSAYIKTENVSEGYAGLWMSIDPSIAFDNMEDGGITGTTEWKRYEITLDMDPTFTKQIVIGGLLVGKGKMWLNDFQVTIDGVDITNAKLYIKK
jgi:hypothetical protein